MPDARYVEYGYTGGKLTSVRDPRGKTTTLAYNATSGYLESILDPLGSYQLQNVVYDGQGRVTSEEDGAGEAITYSYTSSGGYQLTTVTNPGRGATVYTHLKNMVMSVTDPLAASPPTATTAAHGNLGNRRPRQHHTLRVRQCRQRHSRDRALPCRVHDQRTFNATNDPLTETDGRGNTTSYAYATAASADYQVGQLNDH